jgi:hypothetical protein
MTQRGMGLTKLYNLVHDPRVSGDPAIDCLRDAHVEIDRATMAAYEWQDLELEHGFHEFRQIVRWSLSPLARVETLDRLLEENHDRVTGRCQAV